MRRTLFFPLLLLLSPVVTMAQTASTPAPLPPSPVYAGLGWILIGILVLGFIFCAVKTKLLRDQITDQQAFLAAASTTRYKNTAINKIPAPYSLSRTQLGLWTAIIGCSYIYIELCRNCAITDITIDSTLLALMGISAGTAAVGTAIDTSNNEIPHHQDGPSEGLFMDIMSDQNGISIHRFQNVVWTLIAVVIYLCQLKELQCGKLPFLDPTLVALTGISSLAYLGVKVNENKPPIVPVVGPAPMQVPVNPPAPVQQPANPAIPQQPAIPAAIPPPVQPGS